MKAAGAQRKCRICHEYGHRADNRAFHPPEVGPLQSAKRNRSEGCSESYSSDVELVKDLLIRPLQIESQRWDYGLVVAGAAQQGSERVACVSFAAAAAAIAAPAGVASAIAAAATAAAAVAISAAPPHPPALAPAPAITPDPAAASAEPPPPVKAMTRWPDVGTWDQGRSKTKEAAAPLVAPPPKAPTLAPAPAITPDPASAPAEPAPPVKAMTRWPDVGTWDQGRSKAKEAAAPLVVPPPKAPTLAPAPSTAQAPSPGLRRYAAPKKKRG
jgi:hypothetical protein